MFLNNLGFWNNTVTESIVDRITVANGGVLTDLGNGEYMVEPNPNSFSATSMNFSIYPVRDIPQIQFKIRIENINGTSVIFDLRRVGFIPYRPNVAPGSEQTINWVYTGNITNTIPLQLNVNNGSYGRILPTTRFYIRDIQEI